MVQRSRIVIVIAVIFTIENLVLTTHIVGVIRNVRCGE